MTDHMSDESPQPSPTRAHLHVDLDAIAANWKRLNVLSGAGDASAVVKADAYGLGAVEISRRLLQEGCRTFFVAHDFEAVELRKALGAAARIFVFNGSSPDTVASLAAADAIPVLNTFQQAQAWRSTGRPAALMVDTGMNRLGFRPAQIADFKTSFSDISLSCVMSHLACAENDAHPMNRAQLDAFIELTGAFPDIPRSFANSAGICLGSDYCFDLTRPGVGIYGAFSSDAFTPQNVATLTAPLISVFSPSKDDPIIARSSIGYGATASTQAGQRLGVIAYGYADGASRHLSNTGTAWISGAYAPIIGRVSMDLIALDLSAAPVNVQIGDRVEIFGPNINIEDQADNAGTIAYELLTSIGQRVKKSYHGAVQQTVFQDS